MANIITTGKTFSPTESVTSTKLEDIASEATFLDPADETTLELITTGIPNGKLRIKDSGVTTNKLATSSSKTTGVTFAKMQHISTAKVLGRASASEGDVEEAFDFKDENNMASNSATALASQQSIKAYVDSLFSNSVTFNKLDSEIITFTSENSYRDIPDLSVEITPKRANSNFNIRSMLNFGFIENNDEYGMKCQYSVNNGAMQDFNLPTGVGLRSANHLQIQAQTNDGSNIVDFNLLTTLVNPTYTIGDVLKFKLVICGINMITNLFFNRSENDTNNSDHGRAISTLTVTEV